MLCAFVRHTGGWGGEVVAVCLHLILAICCIHGELGAHQHVSAFIAELLHVL